MRTHTEGFDVGETALLFSTNAYVNLKIAGRTAASGASRLMTDPTTGAVPAVSEHELVQLAQNGDTSAFERLYRKYGRRIYAVCLRMVGNPEHAEELVQDTFVRAWEKMASFRHESAFGTWLHRVGVNVALRAIRDDQRREERVTHRDDLDTFEQEIKSSMPETRLDLERAIQSLPKGAREVLLLHDVEGYRYREIAEMLGVADGTVKSQLSRARRLVREALER